jgi:hypothetical protein
LNDEPSLLQSTCRPQRAVACDGACDSEHALDIVDATGAEPLSALPYGG